MSNLFDPIFFSESIQTLKNGPEPDQCNNLIEALQSSEFFLAFWNIFRHLIQGKIIYYPKTKITERIMKTANETFETLGSFKDLKQDTTKIQQWASVFSNTFEIPQEQVKNFIEIPIRLLDCVDLDKMTGFELGQEEQYEKFIDELMCDTKNQKRKKDECKPTLWAVIEFRDIENQLINENSDLDQTTYTIRMPRNQVQGFS